MRLALAASFILFAAPAFSSPEPRQLIAAWQVANSICRGSGDPQSLKTQAECERRASLGGRLDQIGWCYGKEGQIGADYRWHRCAPGSVRPNDLVESNF
ncbi:hypothetical protein [Methylobacterium dankookense]|uniref:hypothetical protein n=1 Tax=Methylobacterium dankookense TaxID=560405 RepID=UPI0011A795C6|nr:hypothetical protein [Methylobacterium dankookense]